MDYRMGRATHVALMIWITLLFLVAWLPFVRSLMDGDSYQWGARLLGRQFGGTGLSGDYWFAAGKAAIGVSLLWFGWRKPNGKGRYAILGWLALMFVDTLYSVVTAPDSFRLRGDTLGVDVSLVWIAPMLDGFFLLLAAGWAARSPVLATPPMGAANRLLVGMALLMLPFQYFLLSSAEGQEVNDVLGVVLTIIGWGLLSAGFAPWGGAGAAAGTARQAG